MDFFNNYINALRYTKNIISKMAALPGFLRRSIKAESNFNNDSNDQDLGKGLVENQRSEWVDSVLLSIKTAAAAAAVPPAKLKTEIINNQDVFHSGLDTYNTSYGKTTKSAISLQLNSLKMPRVIDSTHMDNVSEISDSPYMKENGRKLNLHLSPNFQKRSDTIQPYVRAPATVVKVPVPTEAAGLRTFSSPEDRTYEKNAVSFEKVAHYMQPLKRQEGARKNLVLQPRKIEPTPYLHSLDTLKNNNPTQVTSKGELYFIA